MLQYRILNNKFLDKILKEYDYTNISIGTLKPMPVDQALASFKIRSRSSNYNNGGYRRKKKTETITKKQDRECTLINDPTLDSLEVQKIDEAMAKITTNLPKQYFSLDDNQEILSNTQFKSNKRNPKQMIIKGTKKQNLVNDKSESHHSDQVIIAQK